MCFGGNDPPPPVTPAAPPPPPPVLEQVAPDTAAPTDSESQTAAAQGVKKYRSSALGIDTAIPTAASTGTGSGLGITM